MFVDVLGEDVGSAITLFPPLEDGTVEVVFVEVAGEDLDGLFLLHERWYNTTWIQPVVEYQDGLLCFQYETTMEDVGDSHLLLPLKERMATFLRPLRGTSASISLLAFLIVVLVCYVLDEAHFNCLPSENALPTVFPN